MNYVRITESYQDGPDIVYVSSIGLGKTMAEAVDNCEKTLFKYHPQVKPYYRGIHSCKSYSGNYDFKLEDAFTELRGLNKNPELMQILLDYLPEAITRELPGIKVVSDVTTKTTPNGFVVSIDLQDRDGNEFTLDVGYDYKVGIHVSIFSDKDNRYVSDTSKGYPPECPNIKELLNQYYKHLDRARQDKEESMKQFKCSMQKKESLSKKNEGVTASSLFAIDPKSGHSKIYDELCDIVDNVSYSGVLNAEDATDEYPDAVSVDFEGSSDDSAPCSVMVYIYGKEENDEDSQLSYSIYDEYNNNLKGYISAAQGAPLGSQKGYKISELLQMWNDIEKDIQTLVSNADTDESKKSEANLDDLKGMVVSEGTMRSEDLIPKFLRVLKVYAADKYDEYVKENPEVLDLNGMDDETMGWVVDELFDKLDEIAPEGFYFAAHPDDGACYGFWEVEPDESKKPEAYSDYDAIRNWLEGVMSKAGTLFESASVSENGPNEICAEIEGYDSTGGDVIISLVWNAGEDFAETISAMADELVEYADGFDPEDEAEMYHNSGLAGVPSLRQLLKAMDERKEDMVSLAGAVSLEASKL